MVKNNKKDREKAQPYLESAKLFATLMTGFFIAGTLFINAGEFLANNSGLKDEGEFVIFNVMGTFFLFGVISLYSTILNYYKYISILKMDKNNFFAFIFGAIVILFLIHIYIGLLGIVLLVLSKYKLKNKTFNNKRTK